VSNYTPTHVGTITKYVFIESPRMTPGELALRAYEVSEGAMIKETCFGLQVTGSREQVDRIIAHIRTFDPSHIFVKDRGFPPGDVRRCRANLGGARPGFHGHEQELLIIRNVSAGLEALDKKRGSVPQRPSPVCIPGGIDVKRLKELMEAEEP
jgi:putative methanogenesis marker protein 6